MGPREPGVTGRDYEPQIGDIVRVIGRGYGIVSAIRANARVDVMMRYNHATRGLVIVPCLYDVMDIVLEIPHSEKA